MPERLPYDEAMLFSSVRLKVQDPEIKQGKVEIIKVQTNLGVVERPWGIEGGFAVVYKFRTRSGGFRALRCFRVSMEADTQFRYEQIGPYFHTHVNTITAGFKYHGVGIVVKEQGQGQIYPLIEMDWIDGVTLVDKVDELCKKRDRARLRDLSEQWVSILHALHKATIAHGDLAGLNIMVRSDRRMILIDYDGVYIPSFAGKNPVLLGQPDYQHPQMGRRKFDEHMDAFSALVIYLALLVLSLRPQLWNTYAVHDKGKLLDTNLLFKQKDFQDPQNSPLFRELENLGEQRIAPLVQELKRACMLPVEQVRFPFHLLDADYAEKQALATLKQAITADDDEQILKLWTPELAQYQGARAQLQRVQLAQQRIDALTQWRAVLKRGNLAQIVSGYNIVLDACKSVSPVERDLLTQANTFLQLYSSDDDEALLSVVEALKRLSGSPGIVFTQQEEQRITLARQRKQVRDALQSNTIAAIAASYSSFQRVQQNLTQEECQHVELAYNFLQAYNNDDDNALLAAFESIQQSTSHIQLSQQEEQRIELAQHKKDALIRFRTALNSKNMVAIVAAYDPVLDGSKEIVAEERSRVALARLFVEADKDQNDDELVRAYDSIQNSSHRNLLLPTREEEERVQQARQRHVILEQFRTALKGKHPQKIVDVYYHKSNYTLLSTSKRISSAQRELAQLARAFVQCFDTQDEDGLMATYTTLQQSSHKDAFTFEPGELRFIQEAQARKVALAAFVQALNQGTAVDIDAAYKQMPSEVRARLTSDQLSKVKSAESYLTTYQRLQTAIQTRNSREVAILYNRMKNSSLFHVTSEEQRYIDEVMKVEDVRRSLKLRNERQALKDANKLSQQGGDELDKLHLQLSGAVQRLIRKCELVNVTASIRKQGHTHRLVVCWRWPEEEQVEDAIIIYSPHQLPPVFREIQEVDYPSKAVIRRIHERDKREEILLDRRYTSLYMRVCTLIRDDWENPRARSLDGQYKYYLSPGIASKVEMHGDAAAASGSM